MHKKIQYILLLMLLFTSLIPATAKNKNRISLNDEWQFKQSISQNWLPAQVPGAVHTDLMNNRMIKDPFYGVNEKSLQWIGEKDWEYKKTFIADEALLRASHVQLVFAGLDTYADIYVNDYLVMKCDNMFRTWTLNPLPYLKKGENTIRIYFHSIFKVDMPKYLASPFQLQAWPNNDQADIMLSLYARKAGYNYGWDWGPRLITAGIWRDVYLEYWDDIRIDGTQIITRKLEPGKAKMEAVCTVISDEDTKAAFTVKYDKKEAVRKQVALAKGMNTIRVDFEVKNPELWWTNGLGKSRLYDFDIVLDKEGRKVADCVRTGIRTLEVVREKDEQGQAMFVRLNGKDVFMKGANYIPLDNFPNRVSDSWYEYIIKSAADVNMNMLRIWGGGIYEMDIFYEMCDKYGILVWQDMMFACGMFPADEHYLNSVAEEVKDNVKRLRNHPCIALWNGNNENEISYFGWGWKDRYTPEEDRIYQSNLHKLFYEVIPEAIQAVDETRYYHPTSPVTGYNNIDYNMEDVHFWSVWKGGWLEEYTEAKNIGRFMSEYGFQSYPEMRTIRRFAGENDMCLDSEVMLSHQRARNDQTRDPNFGNNIMKMYMGKYFKVPDDFSEFVYMSQYLQAEAVKIGIEAHRRAKPYCMGTLYWQINDCWPVASWSSIDYYGRWKALQYYARDAYAEVLVSPYATGDQVKFKVISDRLQKMKGDLEITTMTLDGQTVFSKKISFDLDANGCKDVASIASSELYGGKQENEVFTNMILNEKGKTISTNIYYPVYSNKYAYPKVTPDITVERTDEGVNLRLRSSALIRGLYLFVDDDESFFERNFVTLIPGKEEVIQVKTHLSAAAFEKQLKYLSVNQVN